MKPIVECPGGPTWTCMGSGKCSLPDLPNSLCAVGRADGISSESLGIETAGVRARTEMARVIETTVDGYTRAVQDSLSKRGVAEDSIQKIGSLAQGITHRTLNGVAVPRTFFNRETGTYYALAALDTATFVSALKGLKEAGNLSDEVKAEIDRRAESIVDEWTQERERAAR